MKRRHFFSAVSECRGGKSFSFRLQIKVKLPIKDEKHHVLQQIKEYTHEVIGTFMSLRSDPETSHVTVSKKTAGVTFYSDIFVQVVPLCGPGLQFAPCAALLREINSKK